MRPVSKILPWSHALIGGIERPGKVEASPRHGVSRGNLFRSVTRIGDQMAEVWRGVKGPEDPLRVPDDTEMSVSGRIPNWYTNSMRTPQGREPHASMDHEAGGLQSDKG